MGSDQTAGTVTVKTPLNVNVAPPGYYLLFVVQDGQGGRVPSQVGEFIRLVMTP